MGTEPKRIRSGPAHARALQRGLNTMHSRVKKKEGGAEEGKKATSG